MLVPIKEMRLVDYLKHVEESLQSAISYAGGTKLADLKAVEFQ